MGTRRVTLDGREAVSTPLWRRFSAVFADVLRPGHEAALDGVRGLAVALVFFVHIHRIVGPILDEGTDLAFVLSAICVTGQVGVYLFFVLSGFLIYGIVLARRPSYPRFLWRRIQRIYPTFLAVAWLHVIVSLVSPTLSKLPDGVAERAEYIVSALVLLPDLSPDPPLVTVAWTLRYEMAFYLLVGLLVFLPAVYRASRGARIGAILTLVALTLVAPRLLVATMFLFGMRAKELHGAFKSAKLPAGLTPFVALAMAPASLFMFLPEIADDFPSIPAFVADSYPPLRFVVLGLVLTGVVVLAARGDNALARFAGWGPVRMFGIISYSYYLSHGIAIHFVEQILVPLMPAGYHSIPLAGAFLLISMAFTVLVALGFFLFVEYPFSIGRRVAY